MDLGASVAIKGELSASEDLTLCGQMEGSIRLPEHTLTIGPNAEVKAEIVRYEAPGTALVPVRVRRSPRGR